MSSVRQIASALAIVAVVHGCELAFPTELSEPSSGGADSSASGGTAGVTGGAGGLPSGGAGGVSSGGVAGLSTGGSAGLSPGGAGGTGGQGGTVTDAPVDSSGGSGGCKPVDQVAIPTEGGSFCIDATEVTNDAYKGFLTSVGSGALTGLPTECSFKTNHVPAQSWPPAGGLGNYPVGYVDWCDAWAYCAWSGKRLCGKIGGGPIAPTIQAEQSPDQCEWHRACTQAGTRVFPYGDTFVGNACNGVEHGAGVIVEVASLKTCLGGYPDLYDMSGNVLEWENCCESNTDGSKDRCHARGGSFQFSQSNLECKATFGGLERGLRTSDLGIRCCSG